MQDFGSSKPVRRTEDPRLLRGAGRFIDDVNLPRQAHGTMLRSPHAHARIRAIDTRAARAAPGVLLVLTGADYVAAGFGPMPLVLHALPGFDIKKVFPAVHWPLATDRARYVGDGIAFIVAETRAQAMDAAERIEVDYEPLPAVTDPARAAHAHQPAVGEPDRAARRSRTLRSRERFLHRPSGNTGRIQRPCADRERSDEDAPGEIPRHRRRRGRKLRHERRPLCGNAARGLGFQAPRPPGEVGKRSHRGIPERLPRAREVDRCGTGARWPVQVPC